MYEILERQKYSLLVFPCTCWLVVLSWWMLPVKPELCTTAFFTGCVRDFR